MTSEQGLASVDNDELTAFVASTLNAIASGIDQASQASMKHSNNGHSSFEMPSKVVFDVAVTARRVNETDKGLKVEVFSIGAGAKGKNSVHSETVSRISFEVPWQYKRTAPINTTSTRTGWNA